MEGDLKKLYFEILSLLAERGIGIDRDISTLLDGYFLTPKDAAHAYWSERIKDVLSYLDIIKNNGHIKYTYRFYEDEVKKGWVKPLTVSAEITQAGLDYHFENQLRVSTLKSLKNQRVYNIITWVIALISVGGTIGMGIYSTSYSRDLSQQLNSLRQQVQQLKSSQHLKVASDKNPNTH